MKKQLISILALALTLASCQKEAMQHGGAETPATVSHTFELEEAEWLPETKTVYEPGKGVKFTGKEVMSVFYSKPGDAVKYKVKPKEGTTSSIKRNEDGSYTVVHPALDGVTEYDYYFMLSGSQSEVGGSAKKLLVAKVGTMQSPAATSFDPAFDFLVGLPQRKVSKDALSPVKVEKFKRVVSHLKVMLKDSKGVLKGEAPLLVTLSFDAEKNKGKVISGNAYVDIAGDKYAEIDVQSVSSDSWSNTVSARYEGGLAATNGNYEVWYTLFPATIVQGSKISMTVTTATRTITRSVVLTRDLSMAEGTLNTLGFDISGEGCSEVSSLYQDFGAFYTDRKLDKKAIASSLTLNASDGVEHSWGFKNCFHESGKNSVYANKTMQLFPQAVRMKEASATITFPTDIVPAGKKTEKVMIYFHPMDKKSAFGTDKNADRHMLVRDANCVEANWDKEYAVKTEQKVVGIAFEFIDKVQ